MNNRMMVTETWAWYQQQLDFPKYKKIKAHILLETTNKSFCGLYNHTDEGEYTNEQLINDPNVCMNCVRMQNTYYKKLIEALDNE